jgi:hypothetical protein
VAAHNEVHHSRQDPSSITVSVVTGSSQQTFETRASIDVTAGVAVAGLNFYETGACLR